MIDLAEEIYFLILVDDCIDLKDLAEVEFSILWLEKLHSFLLAVEQVGNQLLPSFTQNEPLIS